MTRSRLVPRLALLIAAAAATSACGADPGEAADLPPLALEGREVARSKGCAACHGSSGDGGVAPAFVGLYGADVLLQSGETVVADREYLVRSILEPGADLVDGYNLPMPRTELTDVEIDTVIAYIEALSDPAP
jgi:cytochrome c oxidase subunit 2